jgi:hypothetical protein
MENLTDYEVYKKTIEQCKKYDNGSCVSRWKHKKFLWNHRFYYLGDRIGRDFMINFFNFYKDNTGHTERINLVQNL